jgi:hypothetical protein
MGAADEQVICCTGRDSFGLTPPFSYHTFALMALQRVVSRPLRHFLLGR